MSALHWEALRKQRVVDKKHHHDIEDEKRRSRKEAELKLRINQLQNESTCTYTREVASRNGDNIHHCHHDQDAERRLYFKDRCKTDYNAKMSARYNDINFAQQW